TSYDRSCNTCSSSKLVSQSLGGVAGHNNSHIGVVLIILNSTDSSNFTSVAEAPLNLLISISIKPLSGQLIKPAISKLSVHLFGNTIFGLASLITNHDNCSLFANSVQSATGLARIAIEVLNDHIVNIENICQIVINIISICIIADNAQSLLQSGLQGAAVSKVDLHVVVCLLIVQNRSDGGIVNRGLLLTILATIARIARATSQHTDGHNAGQSQSQNLIQFHLEISSLLLFVTRTKTFGE